MGKSWFAAWPCRAAGQEERILPEADVDRLLAQELA